MNDTERIGLKSLRKMVSNSEIVIVPINKSGCFAVMSLATYELAHSSKNKVVPFSKIKLTKAEIIGHVSMLVKTFKIDKEWNHVECITQTMINNSLAVFHL